MNKRSSGILTHISSLPGPFVNGDLGKGAYQFIDLLAKCQQTWWQVLPVNPIGLGNSPYATVSSFAGEPLFIDLEQLKKAGLLTSTDLRQAPMSNERRVNYDLARKFRYQMLEKAFAVFFEKKQHEKTAFKNFCKKQKYWLDDYGVYMVAVEIHNTHDWTTWPEGLRRHDRKALKDFSTEHVRRCTFYKFLQFCFFEQWQKLRTYARTKKVKLIGDIPIFVSHWSSDVWGHQNLFQLNAKGQMTSVAGVPPDFFNRDGQRWGNALYKWTAMRQDGFAWWVARFRSIYGLFDLVRLDHFIGFYRYWQIPAQEKTAKKGRWQRTPGSSLLATLKRRLGPLRIIAEDLGVIIPPILQLRDQFEIPGMRITQLSFGANSGASYHTSHNFPVNSVAYTATHDFPTGREAFELAHAQRSVRRPHYSWDRVQTLFAASRKNVHQQIMRETLKSPSILAIVMLQDWLGLGKNGRMNYPGVETGNWQWRFKFSDFSKDSEAFLRELTIVTDRGE